MGSSPIRVATFGTFADLAHLVERDLAKVEVAGSSPVIRSKSKTVPIRVPSFLLLEQEQRGCERSEPSPCFASGKVPVNCEAIY